MAAKEEIVKMLNEALELEHAAHVQYLSHAELVAGPNSEPIIERLKEIAGDEAKHAATFRSLIGAYMEGVPSMGIAKTRGAKSLKEILKINLEDEKTAVDVYTRIIGKISAEKASLPYEFLTLEHHIRHIIMEEQEHITELKVLMEKA